VQKDYNLSVSSYVSKEEIKEEIDIEILNKEIEQTVKNISVLRKEIDEIIKELK
jgi:type I restriction enzyme M protein